MTTPSGRLGTFARNDGRDSIIGLRAGNEVALYHLPARSSVTSVPQGLLGDLLEPIAELALLEGADPLEVTAAIDAMVESAGDIQDADDHLDSQHVRSTLLSGLPILMQQEANAALIAEFGDRNSTSTATSTAVEMAYLIDAEGAVRTLTPPLLNRHYDYLYPGNGYQYGGPDGQSGTNSGQSNPTGGGSGGSSGGNDGGSSDGGSAGGGSGGSSGGLPDNFDPNDPSTWPDGVDSFEELLEYLQNLEL